MISRSELPFSYNNHLKQTFVHVPSSYDRTPLRNPSRAVASVRKGGVSPSTRRNIVDPGVEGRAAVRGQQDAPSYDAYIASLIVKLRSKAQENSFQNVKFVEEFEVVSRVGNISSARHISTSGCPVERCELVRRIADANTSAQGCLNFILKTAKTLYILTVLFMHTVERDMEHLVRILNDEDRRTLAWLRQQVGDAALGAAAERCSGPTKPYVSRVCRCLGLRPPAFRAPRQHRVTATAERSLASIRAILAEAAARRARDSMGT
jgi:hypothetical protein